MNDELVSITVKIPQDLVHFIDSVALEHCNKRSGIVRLALTHFRKATEEAEGHEAAAEESNGAQGEAPEGAAA